MSTVHYPPTHKAGAYNCPNCGVYARQFWYDLFYNRGSITHSAMDISICTHCEKPCYWYGEQLLVPAAATVELPNPDLPPECSDDYMEARDIVERSPRGAAALLRLCIQKLLPALGRPGNNINEDIKALVKDGLPSQIQKSLDICRVVGNNAVHPGELDLQDTPEIAKTLFRLINLIVDDRITRPKEIDQIYNSLPIGALEAIEKRDN